jgi:hypothetical protein
VVRAEDPDVDGLTITQPLRFAASPFSPGNEAGKRRVVLLLTMRTVVFISLA